MANYGPRHGIEDKYGKELQVDVAIGSSGASVDLAITAETGTHPASSRVPVTVQTTSPLTPEKARNLAKQLEAAADEAERYGA